MQNDVLLEFLNFLIDNQINLTIDEKIMLKNIDELTFLDNEYQKLTINDLKNWYYSNIRKNKKAISILKEGVNIDIFKLLITLNDLEIKRLLNFKTNKDIYFALIAYSLLNKTIKKVNQEYLDDYNMEIINLLLSLKIIKN